MKRIIVASVAAGVLAGAVALTGCGTLTPSSAGASPVSSEVTKVNAAARQEPATAAGVAAAIADLAVASCVPVSHQTSTYLTQLAQDASARAALAGCMAIPPGSRPAFEDALKTAALDARQAGGFGTAAGRSAFVAQALRGIIEKFEG